MQNISNDHVLFHFRKHHLSELKEYVSRSTDEEFRIHLLSLGLSMFDVYYGGLFSVEIKSEVISCLSKQGVYTEEKYLDWIRENNGFRLIELSDKSSWTLRYLEGESFIHLHPSRYSINTRRIKSQHLKQALWLLRNKMEFNADTIAQCRKALEMSPTGRYELNGLREVCEFVYPPKTL